MCKENISVSNSMKSSIRSCISNSYESELKSWYDNVISAMDKFFDQWDPSSVTLMDCKGDYIEK